MINIQNFIKLSSLYESTIQYNLKLSDSNLKKLVDLDRQYNELVMKRRNGFNEKDIINIKEEMDKFLSAYKKGEKYYPQFDLGKCDYNENLIEELKSLKNEFNSFRECYLSKYYVENLERMIKWCRFYIDKFAGKDVTWREIRLDQETFENAMEVLKEHHYESTKDLHRNIDAKEAAKEIQKAIDELGYPWKTEFRPHMTARMNVLPNKIIDISEDAKFSKADIEGLIEHEVKGHIGRKWNAMKTGLYLFVHGLKGRCMLDEGIAVWNSINNVKHQKPNVLFNIAFRYVVTYLCMDMDFYQVFDYIKKIDLDYDIPDEIIFKTIARSKREIINTKLKGAVPDQGDYFAGYLLINDMNDRDREKLLKWNVGIEQMFDINNFENFFKINKLEPIK